MSAPADRPEYLPLLPIERHALSLDELRALCVDPFPLSATRPRIMAGLEAVIQQLIAVGIVALLWVDASTEQRRILEWLAAADLKTPYACDLYLWIDYPEGHPDYWVGQYI